MDAKKINPECKKTQNSYVYQLLERYTLNSQWLDLVEAYCSFTSSLVGTRWGGGSAPSVGRDSANKSCAFWDCPGQVVDWVVSFCRPGPERVTLFLPIHMDTSNCGEECGGMGARGQRNRFGEKWVISGGQQLWIAEIWGEEQDMLSLR